MPEATQEQMQKIKAQEQGLALCSGPCNFVLGVAFLEQLPAPDRMEIAFAGRSNVGKSSLINAVFCKRDLARASATPGRTQQMNYFDLNGLMYVVDLPGYGYARAPEKQVKNWNNLIFTYLKGRPNLRRVYLLIDARHGIKEKDEEVMKMLDKAAVSYQIVLTKQDKLKAYELEKVVMQTQKKMSRFIACHPTLCVTSSEKKQGLEDVRADIWELTQS